MLLAKEYPGTHADNTLLDQAKMLLLEWYDAQNKKHELRIIKEASKKWYDIGIRLGFEAGWLDEEEKKPNENSKRFQHIVDKWLETGGANYAPTWRGLQEVLVDCEMAQLAEKVKGALKFCILS